MNQATLFRESPARRHPTALAAFRRRTHLSLAIIFLLRTSVVAEDWPQFGRDGTRNPVSPERNPPTVWDVGKAVDDTSDRRVAGTAKNIKWSARLGTVAYGDPVVANGLVWVGTNNGYDPKINFDASVLACFRASDGKPLYRYVSPRLPDARVSDWEYSSISCSPLIDQNHVWFVTNRAEVVCFDIEPLVKGGAEPKVIWKLDMIGQFGVFPRGSPMMWQHTCSIAGYRDLIYVITGHGADYTKNNHEVPNPAAPSLIALNRDTGGVVWRDSSPGANILDGQWSSPTVIEIDGRAQCVAPQGDGWLRSFDALTGEPIWQFDMNHKEAVWNFAGRSARSSFLASPVFHDGLVYISSAQHNQRGAGLARLVCIDPTRRGDVSHELAVDAAGNAMSQRRFQAVDPAANEKAIPNPNSALVWEYEKVGEGKAFEDSLHGMSANVAVHEGFVIAADFEGLVHCLDAKTGHRHWAHDLLSAIHASPLIVDDKVFVADEEGNVSIFGLSADRHVALREVNGEIQPLTQVAMHHPIYCAPVFAHGVLYVATTKELFAIAPGIDEPNRDLTGGFWPQWRGPNRDNVSTETGLLQEWPAEGPPRLWSAVGLGEGIASVALAEGQILTVGYQDESEFVTALDERTGELAWRARIGPAVAENMLMRWLIQRVPTVDGERLYAFTAAGELICLNSRDGKELWRKSYTADFDALRPGWGFGDHPLADGERLICMPGGRMVALDKRTGTVIWTSSAAGAASRDYSAALVAELGGPAAPPIRQYVAFIQQRLTGIAADDGRVLWQYGRVGNATGHAHTPIVRGDHVFCSSGYGSPAALLKLVRDGDNVTAQELWVKTLNVETFQDSSLAVGDQIYAVRSGGFPMCVAWSSGETAWTQRIAGSGRAAFVYADGCLYVRGSEGKMHLVEATPAQFVLKGGFEIPDHQPSLGATSPVVAGGRLYLRDDTRLHCYDVRRRESATPADPPRTIELAAGATGSGGPGPLG